MDRYTAETIIWRSPAKVCALPMRVQIVDRMTVPDLIRALNEAKNKTAQIDALMEYLSQQGTWGNGKAAGCKPVEDWWARKAGRDAA